MKILSLIFVLLGLSIPIISLADPCVNDPACFKAGYSDFQNPNHFVFIGARPGDELSMYPYLKDYCDEENNYCALIIPTRGQSECESDAKELCGETRTLALQESAHYLNTDAWHYNLPDDDEISPQTVEGIKAAYNKIAQESGFLGVSEYFERFFQMQLGANNSLTVITIQPEPDLASHPKHSVIHVIDAFVKEAVHRLQDKGINIAHYYADSQLVTNLGRNDIKRALIRKNDSSYIICRNGSNNLIATHQDLTNFEVFKHGYNQIYPFLSIQSGEIDDDSNAYEFCIDRTFTFFNTNRTHKLLGTLITEPKQIDEIANFSNFFAFAPTQVSDITNYLNINSNRLIPAIEIGQYFFDPASHIFRSVDTTPLIEAIAASVHTGSILFFIDEPFWRIRFSCLKGHAQACAEVNRGYRETRALFNRVGRVMRNAVNGSGIVHTESYAELLFQKNERPSEPVILLDEAEYAGFHCYGSFDNCGIVDFINSNPPLLDDAPVGVTAFQSLILFQVAGTATGIYLASDSQNEENTQLAHTETSSKNSQDLVFLCQGNRDNCATITSAASSVLNKRSQETYLNWIQDSLIALENHNPIGRKIFLIPGAFQDFNFFPSEQESIQQFERFLQVLDTSSLTGGLGNFIWGDLQEGLTPFVGTRSLMQVRSTVVNAFSERIQKKKQNSTYSQPAMSLIGAIGKAGSFKKIKMNNTSQGSIYFQSADMDRCEINIGGERNVIKLNQLVHIPIPNVSPPLRVVAECLYGSQRFTKTFSFVE